MTGQRLAVLDGDQVALDLAELMRHRTQVVHAADVDELLSSGVAQALVADGPSAIRAAARAEGRSGAPALTLLVPGPAGEHPHARFIRILSRAKHDWEATFDALSDALVLLDEASRVVRANLAFGALVHRPVQEIIGEFCGSLLGPSVPPSEDPVAFALAEGRAWTGEARFAGVTGVQLVTACPLEGRRVVLLLRDLRDQKAHQEVLQRTARLADIGQLAGGIAHELNTPLASIALRAESLLRAAQDPRVAGIEPLKNLERYLKTIDEETFRCKKIIGALLDFSRVRQAEVRLVDLNRVVDGAADLLGHEMRSRQVALSVRLEAGLPPVPADDAQIRQMLVALLMNAMEAMPAGGRIRVQTERTPGSRVCLTVEDDGTGMDEGVQARIFTPFFTTKTTGQARGLGLALCHGIVSAHGGEIEFESRLGAGTRFSVFLPEASPDRR